MSHPLLTLDGIHHGYGARDVLRDVSCEIGPGITALIGVNGAGKSTLLSIASGGVRPRQGAVAVGGHDLLHGRARRQGLGKVAFMPQDATFPPRMTAREIVEYVDWMRGAPRSGGRARALQALDRVRLADRAESRFGSLSGGMQRRVCLAQAIVSAPEVLVLDEPSTGLDPEQRHVMVQLIGTLAGAVVLSSHVMEDVADLADRVLVLDDGAITFDGDVAGLRALAPVPEADRAAEHGFLAVLSAQRSA